MIMDVEMSKKKAIIVDIDGTLANNMHRVHYLKGEKKDWKSYNEAMDKDTVNKWCNSIIGAMLTLNYEIILVTGRECCFSGVTRGWLSKFRKENEIYFIYFRPAGDYRPDHEVKKEIYEKYLKSAYDIEFVIDDRQQVVDMWRSLGLVCLQCARGNY